MHLFAFIPRLTSVSEWHNGNRVCYLYESSNMTSEETTLFLPRKKGQLMCMLTEKENLS